MATCDLDAIIITGGSPFQPPFPIGHECVAEVVEVGDAVASVRPGELVSVPFQISCGGCAPCRRGRTGNCSSVAFMSTYGFGPAVERWGGFLSDLVCVVTLGAESVLYVDADAGRSRLAAQLGAETLTDPPKRLGPFPITVDSSAHPEGLALALRSTAPDGTCTSTAIYFGEPPALPLLEMYTKGVTFRTGRAHVRPAIPHVLGLASAGTLRPERITTRVIPWSDAPDALLERGWTKLVFER